MDTINEFLKSSNIDDSEKVDISINISKLQKINQLFAERNLKLTTMRILPKVKQNQIWSIKREYMDYEGNIQKTAHPFIVLICSDPEKLEDEDEFVRVYPLSPFVEKAAQDNIVCEDSSIIGFPFIVESWNEQPILTEILDKYINDYYTVIPGHDELAKDSNEFREIEISNARYLNQSIIACTQNLSRSKDFSFSIDVNFGKEFMTLHMPLMNIKNPKLLCMGDHEEYTAAAKTGCVLTENDSIEYNNTSLPFSLEVRKKSLGYILTVIPKVEITLINGSQEIHGKANEERVVFENLKKGLYEIKTPIFNEIIRIRLK